MGCDIHGIFEAKINNRWQYAGNYQDTRNYMLFAVLAGVRGSFDVTLDQPRGVPGCNGIPGSSEWEISDPQQKPSLEYLLSVLRLGEDGHSHSYATLEELKQHGETVLCDPQSGLSIFHEMNSPEWQSNPHVLTYWDQLIEEMEANKPAIIPDSDFRMVFYFDN